MQVLFLVIVLLSVHEAVGEDDCRIAPAFQFGFQAVTGDVVEGAPFTYCIITKCGAAPVAFNFNVRRSYQSELDSLPVQVTVFMDIVNIPIGFNRASPPVCLDVNAANDLRLGPGTTLLLDIQGAGLPAGVGVAPFCGNARIKVFEDDVIEFEIKDEIITANEGDATVDVCVHVTCVGPGGPNLISAPILFYNEAVAGLADRQKKIILIPKDIVDGDKVCCSFALNPSFPISAGGFVDIPVHVKSEDLNVLGLDYATIRVNDGGVIPPGCEVCFTDNTPEVIGAQVRVRLDTCVTAATCSTPDGSASCDGSADVFLPLIRQTFATLTVDPSAPLGAAPDPLTRRLRRDGIARCDSHLINKGITDNGGNSFTIEFEGTGGTNGPVTTFYCQVEYPMGNIIVPQFSCDGLPDASTTFSIPPGHPQFYVVVIPHPPMGITCSPAQTRVYHFP